MDEEKNSNIPDEKLPISEESENDAFAEDSSEEYEYVFVDEVVEEKPYEDTDAPALYVPFQFSRWLLTLVASLLGAFVALIPHAVLGALTDTNPYVLLALIPVCVYLFSKLLRGYTDSRGLPIMLIVSILGIHCAQVAFTALQYCAQYNIPVHAVFLVSYYLFFAANTIVIIRTGILYILIFSALGLYLLIALSRRDTRNRNESLMIAHKDKKQTRKESDSAEEENDENSIEDPGDEPEIPDSDE